MGTSAPSLNQPFHSRAWQEAKVWSSSGARRIWIAVRRVQAQAGELMAESLG
jgi:hypothetical protein